MAKKTGFALTLVLLFFASAYVHAYTLTVKSPEEGFTHYPGQIHIEMEADFNMVRVDILAKCGTEWEMLERFIIKIDGVNSYTTDPWFAGNGDCELKVWASTHEINGIYYSNYDIIPFTAEDTSPFSFGAYRNLPEYFFPGGSFVDILHYYVKEGTDISGIIMKEKIPENLTVNFDWLNDVGYDYVWDEETRTLKLLAMGSPLESGSFSVYLKSSDDIEAGSKIEFNGTFEIYGTSPIDISGDTEITATGFKMPQCPISDEQLLEYIYKWSKQELSISEFENDEIIMQVIEVWKSC